MIRLLKKIFGKENEQTVYKAEHSIESLDYKMKKTWDYDLMDLLKIARLGDNKGLERFIMEYSPLAVVNEDCSVLLLFRHFHADFNLEINVLNCHPQHEGFQCGITIVTSSEDGGSQSNIYLPNNHIYKELSISGKEIKIITNQETIKTNLTELFRKLQFWMNFRQQDIENGFNDLCNEQYEDPTIPEVKDKKINIASIGEFIYKDIFGWYECIIEVNDKKIELNIDFTTSENLEKLSEFVDEQMKSMFYESAFLEMEGEMIRLKNENWLDEDLETGQEELPMTSEEFKKRIFIESIVFHEGYSSSIYCNDDGMFGGHSIIINVDLSGKYKASNLAG